MPKLRDDAIGIWRSAVAAVDSRKLVKHSIVESDNRIEVCGHAFPLSQLRKIVVVGGGKAGAQMAAGIESSLSTDRVRTYLSGWVNVPALCVQQLHKIHLHAARSDSLNEPTPEGVRGSEEILKTVGQLTESDLCIALISGGGSALLPAPIPPVTLQDKLLTTRILASRGVDIVALNKVRKRLSRIKGGGLARACKAGTLISLILSDIVGDPMDMIASGPTVDDEGSNEDALHILQGVPGIPENVRNFLQQPAAEKPEFPKNVHNYVIGNNSIAIGAAQEKARQLGYEVINLGSNNTGDANQVGEEIAARCLELRNSSLNQAFCILSGGEPTVRLADPQVRGSGGRNQQLVLAAVEFLREAGMEKMAILSAGSDGEDGPTDAAGAVADSATLLSAVANQVNIEPFLRNNDAYTFFNNHGGLLKTGMTHTNVMDIRVALIGNDSD